MGRAAAFLAIALMAGCGSAPRLGLTKLPTWCDSGSCVGVPADPARKAVLHESLGCVWVEVGGRKARPLWPAGFTAATGPFIVYDRSGREVGRDGMSISTQMLGPDPLATDSCGLSQTINLYFPDADGGGIGHTNGG